MKFNRVIFIQNKFQCLLIAIINVINLPEKAVHKGCWFSLIDSNATEFRTKFGKKTRFIILQI